MTSISSAGRNLAPVFSKAMRSLNKIGGHLASGSKLSSSADGAAMLSIANRMRSSRNISDAAGASIQAGKGLLNIQDEALSAISDSIARLKEITIAAQQPLATSADLNLMDAEAQALITAAKTTISATAKYNGTAAFGGTWTATYGENIGSELVTLTTSLGTGLTTSLTGSVTTAGDASTLYSLVDGIGASTADALSATIAAQAAVAVNSNLLDMASNIQQINSASFAAQESALRDVDYASESAAFTKQQVVMSAAQSVMAQSNNLIQGNLKFLS